MRATGVDERLQVRGIVLPDPPCSTIVTGRGARSAVGAATLPFGIRVEIEAVVQVAAEQAC